MKTSNIYMHHRISTDITERFALHCHNFYEVYFFIRGNTHYFVEGVEYHPEPYSMLLVSSNVLHGVSVQTEHPYERFSVHFLPEILHENNRELLLSPFKLPTIYYNQIDDFNFNHYFDSMLSCEKMDAGLQMTAIQSRLESLLSQIVYMQKQSEISPEIRSKTSYAPHKLILYINNHLQESLSLNHLESLFFIGKNQLNRSFQEVTGTTIHRYINQKRAALARQYILEGMSPAAASIQSGFQDYSNFFRTYKKIYGYAPGETRLSCGQILKS